MSFTYTTGIPAAANNPSNDQPNMQVNTNTIDSWTSVDHIGFNNSTSGQHKQVTFNANQAAPAIPAGAVSNLYTNVGTADATRSQLFFQNTNSTVQLSAIRAWGVISSAGAIVSSQAYNATVVRNSVGSYTVTLTNNCVASGNYAIILTSAIASPGNLQTNICYQSRTITGFNVFIARSDAGSTALDAEWSFQVMQI